MKEGYPECADSYRSRGRKKKKELDRLSKLERQVQWQQQQIDLISQQRASQQLQLEEPQADAAPSQQKSCMVEASAFGPPAARYPVDDVMEKTSCELHMSMKNMSFKVAVGSALPNQSGASYHLGGIPAGYARVGVDEVVPLYANMELDIPGGDGEKTLGEAGKAIVLWKKEHVVFPNLAPRPPIPPSR